MANAVDSTRVSQALSRIGSEARYGLVELEKLKAEGRITELDGRVRSALEAILSITAKGPPAGNARFILDQLSTHLVQLHTVIRATDGSTDTDKGGNKALLGMLLRAVTTPMLAALTALED